jgi:hypothetical protein
MADALADSGARDAVVAALKRFRPLKVRAVFAEGDPRDVAVPMRRRRWEAVADTLEALPSWVRVEMMDKAGALLGAIEADGDATTEKRDKLAAREHAMLDVMLRAQEMALKRQNEAMAAMLNGYTSLANLALARLSSLERSYASALDMMHAAAQRLEPRAADDEGPLDELARDVLKSSGLLPERKAVNGKVEP